MRDSSSSGAAEEARKSPEIPGLDDSSDSEGQDVGTKDEAETLKGILAEEDSDSDDGAKSLIITPPPQPPATAEITPASSEPLKAPPPPPLEPVPGKEQSHPPTLSEILNDDDEEGKADSVPVAQKTSDRNTVSIPDPKPVVDPIEIVDLYENSSRLSGPPTRPATRYIEECIAKGSLNITRMAYMQYRNIPVLLSNPDKEKSWGRPSCLATLGNYFYVGTSLGMIRVFDLKEVEYMPIVSKEVEGQRVTCIDTSVQSRLLAAGYGNGKVLVWDMTKTGLIQTVSGVHKHAVLAVRFLRGPRSWIMSSDVDGQLYLTEFSKSIWGAAGTSSLLLKNSTVFSLSPLLSGTDSLLSLVAVGGVNAVLVISLEPAVRIVWEMKRRTCVKRGIPYVDWGKGALPGDPENPFNIVAIAWDRVIQLVLVKDAIKSEYVMNGYYESEHEIQTMWWVAEGVIVVLDSCKTMKVLYSGKFAPGEYREKTPEEALKEILARKQSDGEIGHTHKIDEDIYMQVYNIGGATEKEKEKEEQVMKNSCHQTFIVKGREILGLTKTQLLSGRLLSWGNYMQFLTGKEYWIDALRIGLEFYQGTLKGFADLSECRSVRESQVRTFMKSFVKEGLYRHLEKPKKGVESAFNLILMNVTVEFCVRVSACDFMFTDLLMLFAEYDLESAFLAALEPYILTGEFKAILVNRDVVYKQINYYVKQGRLDLLERILIFLGLQGQDLDYLSNICITNKMFSALIYIKTLQGNDYQYVEPALYMHHELVSRSKSRKDTVDMGALLGRTAFSAQIEQSYNYLGYKILWYIQLCFKGDKFPQHANRGDKRISAHNWPSVVYSLLNWLFIEVGGVNNLQILLELDSRAVFGVFGSLFQLRELRGFLEEPEKYSRKGDTPVNSQELLRQLEAAARRTDSSSTRSLYYFNLLLARIGGKMEVELCVKTAQYLLNYGETEHESLILDMLIRCCVSLTREHVSELINSAAASPYAEILIYLTELTHDFAKCFEVYFAQGDRKKAIGVFAWLEHVLVSAEDVDKKMFQRLIYDNLEKMLALDVEKTMLVVDAWFEAKDIGVVVERLKLKPKTQLDYILAYLQKSEKLIESVIMKDDTGDNSTKEAAAYRDLMATSIRLLCESHRVDDVLKYVKKKYYPVTACLEICKKHQINSAVAYLLKRTGAYSESLGEYIKLLKETADKLLDSSLRKAYIEHNLSEYKLNFSCALKVCKKSADLAGKDHSLWFALLSHLQEIWLKLPQAARIDSVSATIKDCIKRLLSTMMGYVRCEELLAQITAKYGELEVENFQEMFLAIVLSYVLQEKTLAAARQILIRELHEQFGQLVKHSHKGRSICEGTCARCRRYIGLLSGTEYFAFTCGHVYHPGCVKIKTRCEVCLELRRGIVVSESEGERTEIERSAPEVKAEVKVPSSANRRVSGVGLKPKKMEIYLRRMKVFEKMRGRSFPYTSEDQEREFPKDK